MAIQYKPTKQKKEKPQKIPKAPKAEKPMKIGAATKVKTTKPAKEPKAPKPEKTIKANKLVKEPKADKAVKLDSSAKKFTPKQLVKPIIAMVAVLLIAVVAIVFVDKKQEYDSQIAKVLVSSFPEKLQYYVGDQLRYEGLKLQVVLNGGDSYLVDGNECEFSGFDSSKVVERQTITVSYKGFTCTYKIEIKEAPKPARVVKNIYLETAPMTEYKVGQWLSTVGGVVMVEYEDGTYMRHNLTNQDVFGFVTDAATESYVTQQPGTYELEIRYREGGVTKTCTYTITVTE